MPDIFHEVFAWHDDTHIKMVLIDDWFTINFRWNFEANIEVEDKTAIIHLNLLMCG